MAHNVEKLRRKAEWLERVAELQPSQQNKVVAHRYLVRLWEAEAPEGGWGKEFPLPQPLTAAAIAEAVYDAELAYYASSEFQREILLELYGY